MVYLVAAFVLDERGEILSITKTFQSKKDALEAIKKLKKDGNEKKGIFLLTAKEVQSF
jgi:peroxiredoxin